MKPTVSFPEPSVALTKFPMDSTKLSPFSANVPVYKRGSSLFGVGRNGIKRAS
jgi:hypothetical protein